MRQEQETFLEPTPCVESDHPEVVAFARRHARGTSSEVRRAVQVYYAVRDGIRYNPYTSRIEREPLRASATLRAGESWCVGKAVLLAACCRALGIPARLGFADVRNHLSTARIRAVMRTDVFYWHGFTSILLEGKWVKATPAFNLELCRKFEFLPLEFDGHEDSLYHPFDAEGRRHMEYLRMRGEYADVPLDEMRATFRKRYPWIMAALERKLGEPADFDREVDEEVGSRR